jgi:hypothetical protein
MPELITLAAFIVPRPGRNGLAADASFAWMRFVTRRTMTIARFGEVPNIKLQPLFTANQLFDARLVWLDPVDRRFMLTGWERIERGSEHVEFVQSWLVFLDQALPYPEQKAP